MKKTFAALAVVALSASLAVAGEHGFKGGRGHHRGAGVSEKLAQKLNLSDAQKAQIRDLQAKFRADNKAFFESSKATRQEFRDAKKANDTAKLEALRPAMEAQRAQFKQLRDAQQDGIRNILTADQRAKLDALKAEHKTKRDGRNG
jgi:periplasmic protein CpxP/Spy